jgi:hypothetical protein
MKKMQNSLNFSNTKLGRLVGTLAVSAASVLLLGFSTGARADTGPYFVSYPGYCNVKQLYMDNQGTLYGREIGCEVSIGEPMVGVFSSDGVHVARASRSSGLPCIETYWFDGTLSGACSDGNYIYYEPTLTYGAIQRKQGTSVAPARIAWKLEKQMPDLNALRSLPPTSK